MPINIASLPRDADARVQEAGNHPAEVVVRRLQLDGQLLQLALLLLLVGNAGPRRTEVYMEGQHRSLS